MLSSPVLHEERRGGKKVKEGGTGTILQQQLGAVKQEHAARRAKRLGSFCER